MVILFLTSGLEPGKDGVGDYTRLLATECVRQNHSSLMLSLNDPFVSQPVESIEMVDDVSIPTLRLPENLSWKRRSALAGDFRARHSVDWVSLQFVCYGFHPKGILWNKSRYFESIIKESPLHVMFHETWIGVSKNPSIKNRIIGQIQRYCICRLIERLKPRVVATSNAFYLFLLKKNGITSTEMPLSGSVPPSDKAQPLPVPEGLIQAGICDRQGRHPDRQVGLFFGAIYPEWQAEPFMSFLVAARNQDGPPPCLISAGRQGKAGQLFWKQLQENYSHAIEFVTLGECSIEQLASLMQIADFGLATTPDYLLGKSSAVASMLDQGLPVIVTRLEFQNPAYLPDDSLIHLGDDTLPLKLRSGLKKRPARNGMKLTAHNFLQKLEQAI